VLPQIPGFKAVSQHEGDEKERGKEKGEEEKMEGKGGKGEGRREYSHGLRHPNAVTELRLLLH